ncbi:hypothetical protein [Lyngbya sp. CCAP 1446/10]|uniref:hypothetical protein n=1 Tax=Lyngbya sp. CCAP 1446/10 TaxID=439293 RepID=UPI00223745FE|nr:hypothetical protein [Lyngbya sp. CCAP 1446/10]
MVLVKNPPDSSVGSINNLTTLNLNDNQITDISVLGELAQKRLTLSTTPIDGKKPQKPSNLPMPLLA